MMKQEKTLHNHDETGVNTGCLDVTKMEGILSLSDIKIAMYAN